MAQAQLNGINTTIAFATSGFQAKMAIETLQINFGTRPALPTTVLNATKPTAGQFGGHTSKPGALWTAPTFTVDIWWDPAVAQRPPTGSTEVAETVTITFPDASTLVGSGYITGIGQITVMVDGLMKSSITVQGTGIWS